MNPNSQKPFLAPGCAKRVKSEVGNASPPKIYREGYLRRVNARWQWALVRTSGRWESGRRAAVGRYAALKARRAAVGRTTSSSFLKLL